MLITNDRGKKDKTIFAALAQHRVNAVFVHSDLLAGPPHKLALALLRSEDQIAKGVAARTLLHHRLRIGGGLETR